MRRIQRAAGPGSSGHHRGLRLVDRGIRVDGRQGLEEHGNRFQIAVIQVLGAVVDHIGHAADNGEVGRAPGLEQLHQFGWRPAAQTVGLVAAQIGRVPVVDARAGEIQAAVRPAGPHGFFLQKRAARGMAGAAVPESFNEISAAVPLRGLLGVGLVNAVAGEHPVPHRQRPAHVQRPGNVFGLVGLRDRLHAVHEIGVERVHVLRFNAGIRGVGHGRVEIAQARRLAVAHGFVELRESPVADAVRFIRRDVGRVHLADAHGQIHRQAAGKGFAARRGVAGDAVARAGQIGAAHHFGVVRGGLRGKGGLDLQAERAASKQGQKGQTHRESPGWNGAVQYGIFFSVALQYGSTNASVQTRSVRFPSVCIPTVAAVADGYCRMTQNCPSFHNVTIPRRVRHE